MKMIKPWLTTGVATGIILAVSVLMARPLLADPAGKLINDYDGAMISWALSRVTDKVARHDFAHFFDGEIFYPHRDTLAFSDPYIGLALLLVPVWVLTHEPIVLQTMAVLLSVSLTGLMLYFWLEELSRKKILSLVISLIWITSPLYVVFLGHVHTAFMPGVILGLLALTKLTQKDSGRWWYVWGVAFWWQTVSAPMTGAFMGLMALGWWGLFKPFRIRLRQDKRQVLGLFVAVLVALVPVLIAFLRVSQRYEYVRSIREAAHFSLSPDQLAGVFASPLLYGAILLGGVMTFFVRKKGLYDKKLWVLGLGLLVLALGPVLKWQGETVKVPFPIPLPYSVLYYLVPPLQAFRAVIRFIVPGSVVLLGAAVYGLRFLPQRYLLGLSGLLVSLMLLWFPKITVADMPTKDEYPHYVYWLRDQPDGVVIELPIFRWGSDEFSKNETQRMLYQTVHSKPQVNGYSGFSPPEWEEMVALIQGMDVGEEMMEYLRKYGAAYVVIHPAEYMRWRGEAVDTTKFNVVYEDSETVIVDLKLF
jgi:glycerol uptake facilitator-like aquaporin